MTLSHLGFKQTASRGAKEGTQENPLGPAKGQLMGFIFGVGSRELRFETKACAKPGNPGSEILEEGGRYSTGAFRQVGGGTQASQTLTAHLDDAQIHWGASPVLTWPPSYFLAHKLHEV